MQRIRYAGHEYLADDGMAEAVLDYARVLAEHRRVDAVRLRVGRDDGSVGRVVLLIGQGIPIAVDSLPDDGPGLDGQLAEPDVERRLRALAGGFTSAPAFMTDPAADASQFVE